ncbi:MAG: pyruvate carboxylase subunit B, partial [Thermoplasmatota archaeon]
MVELTDTTLRDAHQSLLATRLRTRDVLPICDRLDAAGFHSLEVWGGATFDACVRFLNESPWERLRALRRALPNSRLQMLLRGQNLVGYRHYPDDIVERFVVRAARNGIDVFRVFDALNDVRNMEFAIKVAKREGKEVQGAVCYTISPVHTVERFLETFKELAELGCDSLCIKDMAGLITPHVARELVGAVKKQVGLPLSLHSHCTAGLAPLSYLAAAEAGCDVLDTAISPMAGGTSQPATETIVAALKGTAMDTGIDLSILLEIKEYFVRVRERYGGIIDPISERVDPMVLLYQIPGGMVSNLVSQLKEQGALDRYREVLEETPRVRGELGYPPLVTPTSQLVGTQAVFNVLSGERYKIVSREVRDYLSGRYGRTPAPVSEEVRRKVMGDAEPISVRPADLLQPEWPRVVEEGRELGVTGEEELLILAICSRAAEPFLSGRAREEELVTSRSPDAPAAVEEIAREVLRDTGANSQAPSAFEPGGAGNGWAPAARAGPRRYRVRVGEKVFDVSIEPFSGPRSCGTPVWFPFGISRSREPSTASSALGPVESRTRARARSAQIRGMAPSDLSASPVAEPRDRDAAAGPGPAASQMQTGAAGSSTLPPAGAAGLFEGEQSSPRRGRPEGARARGTPHSVPPGIDSRELRSPSRELPQGTPPGEIPGHPGVPAKFVIPPLPEGGGVSEGELGSPRRGRPEVVRARTSLPSSRSQPLSTGNHEKA